MVGLMQAIIILTNKYFFLEVQPPKQKSVPVTAYSIDFNLQQVVPSTGE